MATSHVISTDHIHLSPKRAARASAKKVEQYRRLMEEGREFPPVVLIELPNGTYDLRDGRHRYLAAQAAGFSFVDAVVR